MKARNRSPRRNSWRGSDATGGCWNSRSEQAGSPSPWLRVDALEVTEDSATIQVWTHDAVAQRYRKQTITFGPDGMRLLPSSLRYSWPSEIDLMAGQAGLRLAKRYRGWDRRPFGPDSTDHVSVYRLSGACS